MFESGRSQVLDLEPNNVETLCQLGVIDINSGRVGPLAGLIEC